ncbi:MAG: ROK family protein [Microbacteriaceae bacterium]
MTRMARALSLGPGPAVLAFDVGGTDIKSALVDSAGSFSQVRRTPTTRGVDAARAITASLAELASPLVAAAASPVAAAGVSVPGLVDEAAGIGVLSANLGWRDAPIRDLATRALGLPVAFGHDVRAAGVAEQAFGAARDARSAVVVVIGTGIAGAIILDGRPYAGQGFAGEIGHSLAVPDGELCPCGARGCLETVASAHSIARRYTAETGEQVRGAREVLVAALGGDAAAARIWDSAVDALAQSLARLVALLAPEVIVIGGGLSGAGDALFRPLGTRLDELLSFHARPRLVRAELGDDAGLLGTAIAARRLAGAP